MRPLDTSKLVDYISTAKFDDIKLLFVAKNMHSESIDLLIMVNTVVPGFRGEPEYNLHLFGVSLNDKFNKKLECLECTAKWANQVEVGGKKIMSFFKLKRSLAVAVFSDGTIWHV